MNAFICRFLFNTAAAFTRYTFRLEIIFVSEYKLAGNEKKRAGSCLKIAFRQLYVTVCGR